MLTKFRNSSRSEATDNARSALTEVLGIQPCGFPSRGGLLPETLTNLYTWQYVILSMTQSK